MHQRQAVPVHRAADDPPRPGESLLPARLAHHLPGDAGRAWPHALPAQLVSMLSHHRNRPLHPFLAVFLLQVFFEFPMGVWQPFQLSRPLSSGLKSWA